MTFLSTGLLVGLLAVAVPVALHLLARQQPKRVVLPTTRFIKQTVHAHRDRLRVRRWWLLAMRMLAIGLLAFALARPQIHTVTSEAWFVIGAVALIGCALLGLATLAVYRNQSAALRVGLTAAGLVALLASGLSAGVTMARAPQASVTDSSPTALAIVFDNSIRSTRRFRAAGGTGADREETLAAATDVIGRMRAAANWIMDEHSSESLVAIIDRSPRPATFSVDRAAALNRIERTMPLAQVAPLSERVRAAIALVQSSALEKKSVLVLTDLTKPSFEPELWQSAGIDVQLQQEPAVTLQFLDVGEPTSGNFSLEQLQIDDPTPPRLAKSNVSVTITPPSGDREANRTVGVQLDLYDTTSEQSLGLPVVRNAETVYPPRRSVDRTTLEMEGTAVQAVLSVPPLPVGTHHGVVRLMLDDELLVDNERYVTWVVREPKRICLVGENREELLVLAGALNSPSAFDDPLAEYKIDLTEFLPSDPSTWRQYATIVLVNPPLPSPPLEASLAAYLSTGGQLVSLLGPAMKSPGETSQGLYAGLVRTWRSPAPGTFLEVVREQDPAVQSLQQIVGGVPWHLFRVQQYWQFALQPADTLIARYAGTEHAAVMTRRDGSTVAGTHLIVTTPLPALVSETRAWNQLFSAVDAWPAFLLFRDLVASLVYAGQGQHNLMVGQSTRLPVATESSPAENPSSPALQRIQMFVPERAPVPLPVADDFVSLTQLDTPGTYWLKSLGMSTGVSVNLASAETDLSRIDAVVLTDYLGPDVQWVAKTLDELRQAEGRSQPTRSLYPTILILMLAAFLFEQLLANRFYASASRPANSAVAA